MTHSLPFHEYDFSEKSNHSRHIRSLLFHYWPLPTTDDPKFLEEIKLSYLASEIRNQVSYLVMIRGAYYDVRTSHG